MTSRRRFARTTLVALPAALALAACSSSTTAGNGSASSAGGSSSAASGSSAAPSTSAGSSSSGGGSLSVTAASLAAQLQSSFTSIKTAHIQLNVTASGATITGAGDEKLDAGKLVALSLSETVPGAGDIKIVIVGGKIYAQLPAQLNKSSKPWVLVSTSSSNSVIRQLASSIASTQTSASLTQIRDFVAASSVVQAAGTAKVAGTTAKHYKMVVQVSKLPASFPNRDALVNAGLKSLPLDLYLDGQGRPVRVDEKISVSGQSVSTSIVVSRYNQPVSISAPPASQVATS